MSDPLDTFAPWTIKSFPTALRLEITTAAARQQVTVGQLLERVWLAWVTDGSPVRVEADASPERTMAVMEMLANMGRAGVTVQKGVGALANRLAKRELKQVLGPVPVRKRPAEIAAPAAEA